MYGKGANDARPICGASPCDGNFFATCLVLLPQSAPSDPRIYPRYAFCDPPRIVEHSPLRELAPPVRADFSRCKGVEDSVRAAGSHLSRVRRPGATSRPFPIPTRLCVGQSPRRWSLKCHRRCGWTALPECRIAYRGRKTHSPVPSLDEKFGDMTGYEKRNLAFSPADSAERACLAGARKKLAYGADGLQSKDYCPGSFGSSLPSFDDLGIPCLRRLDARLARNSLPATRPHSARLILGRPLTASDSLPAAHVFSLRSRVSSLRSPSAHLGLPPHHPPIKLILIPQRHFFPQIPQPILLALVVPRAQHIVLVFFQ